MRVLTLSRASLAHRFRRATIILLFIYWLVCTKYSLPLLYIIS